MISLCIKNNNPKTLHYLIQNISNINMDNIIYSQRKFANYENIIIHYTGNAINDFFNTLSNIISDCIIELYEPTLIKNIIYANYFYFNPIEIEEINKNCLEFLLLNCAEDSIVNNHFSLPDSDYNFSDRKITLWVDVLKYLTSNKSIFLDGFIRFKIKDYLSYLDNLVDISVNQFVLDNEYSDFIDILKLYIKSKDD